MSDSVSALLLIGATAVCKDDKRYHPQITPHRRRRTRQMLLAFLEIGSDVALRSRRRAASRKISAALAA